MTDRAQVLRGRQFDVIVVGAGIHGAYAAWDAALRGCRVLLLDRGDFGGATSSNSMHIVHGGLRYLQNADISRLTQSLQERRSLLCAAPHLARTLPCVMPTFGAGIRGRPAMQVALTMWNGAQRILDSHRCGAHLPAAHTVSRSVYRDRAGPLAIGAATGAAIWYDGFLESPERLLIGVVRAAAAAGATVMNYAEVTSLCRVGNRITGVAVLIDDQLHIVEASVVLDATGPWTSTLSPVAAAGDLTRWALAYNVIVARSEATMAVAIPHPTERRMLFAVPWRGLTILGTGYRLMERVPLRPRLTRADVLGLLDAINVAASPFAVREADIRHVHVGLVPAEPYLGPTGAVVQRDRPIVFDSRMARTADRLVGLVTLVGVKWTTARAAAERAVDHCERLLNRRRSQSATRHRAVIGGRTAGTAGATPVTTDTPALDHRRLQRLGSLYGSVTNELLGLVAARPELADELAPGSDAIGAQVVHAVRVEMARHLSDVVLRRTDLGTTGPPPPAVLRATASLMAEELGWDESTLSLELAALREHYSHLYAGLPNS